MGPDPDQTRREIHEWNSRLDRPMPEWFEWAVAAAQYHLPDCNWIKDGVTANQHCSCSLTRVIAKIIEEARAEAQNT